MNTCPVFRRSGGHSYETTVPGPIGSILAPSRDQRKYRALPFACTMCGSCTDICPVKIDLHHQLLAMRKELGDKKILPWSKTVPMRIAGFVLRRPWLYRLTGKLARVLLRYSPRFLIYNRFNRWGIDRELPEPPRQSFRKLYQLEFKKERD
jgi:L-lactate dehydrogenase complex protein LldF